MQGLSPSEMGRKWKTVMAPSEMVQEVKQMEMTLKEADPQEVEEEQLGSEW